MVKKYDEYFLDSILENVKIDELFLYISQDLYNILMRVNHPIAKRIIDKSNKGTIFNTNKFKVTFLDVVNKVDEEGNQIFDIISFAMSEQLIKRSGNTMSLNIKNKEELSSNYSNIINDIYRNKSVYSTLGRSETSIGRLINRLFEREYPASGNSGQDIESFVNLYKSARNPQVEFELVNGDDIIYWYNHNQYAQGNSTVLGDSCMRYDRCNRYIEFYAKNPDNVSLLILKDDIDPTKIRGRALVWKLDDPSGRIYMDRIFYNSDYLIDLFKNYAEKNGWIYKKNQNNSAEGPFIDTKTHETLHGFEMFVRMKDTYTYPYLDTLKFYTDGVLTNAEIDDYDKKLTKTDGSYRSRGVWSDFYDEYIDVEHGDYYMCAYIDEYRNSDDSFYSDFYDVYVASDYSDDHGRWCDHYNTDNGWRKSKDCIQLVDGSWSDNEYAEENFEFSSFYDKYVYNPVWSNYYNTNLEKRKAVRIYTNKDASETDWRVDDNSTYKIVNGNYYDNNVIFE